MLLGKPSFEKIYLAKKFCKEGGRRGGGSTRFHAFFVYIMQ